jgi:phosphoglycerate dehydrogenase-like enzyme
MSTVLVMLPPVSPAAASWPQRLRADVPGITVIQPDSPEQVRQSLRHADAAYGILRAEWVADARSVRWLQAPLAQPPVSLYSRELIEHPMVVTNMRATYHEHVATHAVTLLLALSRGLPGYARLQREHRWERSKDPFDAVPAHLLNLPDATVLLVGAGAIGQEIALRLAPFGCRVIATDARVTEPPRAIAEVRRPEELDELLPGADAVVVSVPLSPATESLFDAARFARCRVGAYFVNVGRGAVVDTLALADAVAGGQLRGAAVDVVREEPLPPEHPLWDTPGVIITPHVAADGPGKTELRYQVLKENCLRFSTGEPLLNVVDKAAWF